MACCVLAGFIIAQLWLVAGRIRRWFGHAGADASGEDIIAAARIRRRRWMQLGLVAFVFVDAVAAGYVVRHWDHLTHEARGLLGITASMDTGPLCSSRASHNDPPTHHTHHYP